MANENKLVTFDNIQHYHNKLSQVVDNKITEVVTGSLDDYATEQWVNEQGFLTEHQDISHLAIKEELGFIKGDSVGSAIVKDSKNCSASGEYSISGGEFANATGEASVALGRGCEASGKASIALGGFLYILKVTGNAGATTYTTSSYINEYFVGSDIFARDNVYTNKLATIKSVSGNQFTVDTTLSSDTDLNEMSFIIKGCQASGSSSVALGLALKSSEQGSYAEGYNTISAGTASHAEGCKTIASGKYSHAEGFCAKAINKIAHAEGYCTTASGECSHAEGTGTLNIYITGENKIYTISAGSNFQNSFSYTKELVGKRIIDTNSLNTIATVVAYNVNEDGYTVTVTLDTDLGVLEKSMFGILITGAYGDYSHSEQAGVANGKSSHTQGDTIANGENSFSQGAWSVADGEASAVFGTNNYAQNNSEIAIGISNHSHTGETPSEQTLFSVGCGDWNPIGMDTRIEQQIPLPTPEDGKNALEIMRNGDIYLGGYEDGIQLYIAEENKVNENLFSVDLSNYYNKSEIDTKVNDKQDELVSGTNIKTINGASILGSGNINGNAYQLVNHGTSDTTFTLTPNTFHVWDKVDSLTLTIGDEFAGVANEYIFQFTSGSEPTTLILPDSIKFNSDFIVEENNIYQISILNGLGTVMSWEFVPSIVFPITLEIGDNGDIGILLYAYLQSVYGETTGTALNEEIINNSNGLSVNTIEYATYTGLTGYWLNGYDKNIVSYVLLEDGYLQMVNPSYGPGGGVE